MRNFYLIVKIFFVISLILIAVAANGADTHATRAGTLIVTYQTGLNGERLDRIRFLIQDTHNHQQMYPKGVAFVDDENSHSKMVVIDDLPRGEFTLEWVLPNHDQLFEEVSSRKFTITKDEVVKIDQVIKVRYASVQAIAQPASDSPQFSTLPWITLMNDTLHIPCHTSENKLHATNLVPGSYTVTFQDLPGYITPSPVTIKLSANQNAGPIVGMYSSEK